MNYTNQELEAQAYARGDTVTAELYARIIELEAEVEQLEEKLSDVVTLESWESSYGPAYDYYRFFHDCFARLSGHYPCPSIGSEHDKGVIFAAIEKGEGVTE
jgi:hypothetical protein